MQLLIARARSAERELLDPVTEKTSVRVTVDQAGDRAEVAPVQLVHITGDRRQITHLPDRGDVAVLAQHIRVVNHVDASEVPAPKRRVAAGRSRKLREIANQQATTPAVSRHSSAVLSRIGTTRPCSSAAAIASSYPASACRSTPVPGSVASTRSSRSPASSVPSATTTIPA